MRCCHSRVAVVMISSLLASLCATQVPGAPPTPAKSSVTAKADAAQAGSEDLAAQALAAKAQFRPVGSDRVAAAATRLKQAMAVLAPYLATGTAENAARWKDYLNWDELVRQVEQGASADVNQLGRIATRYYRNFTSLEHPHFAAMRAALLDFRTTVALANEGDLADKYASRLDELAQWLRDYEQNPTMDLNQQIGRQLGWLESAGQAPALVSAVRARYWSPNLYASVSQRMVSTGVGSDITETTPVQDCILGTSLFGTAHMQGRTQAELIENSAQASIQLILTGTVRSDNVGYNRGVQILSQGNTQVYATKLIQVDVDGMTSQPAQACCDTESTIHGISARSPLIERIAWKRARRSKAAAEQIASQHAEVQIAERVDARALEMLQQARKDYQEKFRKPLLRRDEFPQDIRFRTTPQQLEVTWRQANATQLAAPGRPAPMPGQHDVAVQLHESFVSNFSRAMLGGVRLTGVRLVEILQSNKMEIPAALLPSEDKEPWAITFASSDPLSATFSDNTIRFAIRGRQFELGDRVVGNTLEMSAVYRLEKTPTGAHLTRQGDVSVEYVGVKGQLSTELVIVRTVMRQKFEALFAPEFSTTGVELPGRGKQAGMLHLQQMAAQNGWLDLAWRLTSPSAKPPATDAAPAMALAH